MAVAANVTAPVATMLSGSSVLCGAIAATRGTAAATARPAAPSFVALNATRFERCGRSGADVTVADGAGVAVVVVDPPGGREVATRGAAAIDALPPGAADPTAWPGPEFLDAASGFVLFTDAVRRQQLVGNLRISIRLKPHYRAAQCAA
jgi:hypothetical protein